MLSSTENSFSRVDLAEQLLGHVDWLDYTQGYCTCPGVTLHTGRNGFKDCKVFLNGAPTIFCQHTSCTEKVAEYNRVLRSGAPRSGGISLSTAEKKSMEERQQRLQEEDSLKRRARAARSTILAEHAWSFERLQADSPVRLDVPPENHWRLLLNQFQNEDVIWIGGLYDSGQPHHSVQFRPKEKWLQADEVPNQFICPSTFQPGSYSRTKGNIRTFPFLVVESDILTKDEIGAIFCWLQKCGMALRAVVDTGGKSLHGWFTRPFGKPVDDLRLVLPELGCDPKLFNLTQPVRLPGARRGDRYQRLVYLKEQEVSNVTIA